MSSVIVIHTASPRLFGPNPKIKIIIVFPPTLIYHSRSKEAAMTSSDNISLMQRWYREVWRERNDETVRESFSPPTRGCGVRLDQTKKLEALKVSSRLPGAFAMHSPTQTC